MQGLFGSNKDTPVFQDADVHYVNIFFTGFDNRYDDMHLLRVMQTVVRGDLATITSRPLMQRRAFCFSVEVNGTYATRRAILDVAEYQIHLWMRNLPTAGLPFSRGDIFRTVF